MPLDWHDRNLRLKTLRKTVREDSQVCLVASQIIHDIEARPEPDASLVLREVVAWRRRDQSTVIYHQVDPISRIMGDLVFLPSDYRLEHRLTGIIPLREDIVPMHLWIPGDRLVEWVGDDQVWHKAFLADAVAMSKRVRGRFHCRLRLRRGETYKLFSH